MSKIPAWRAGFELEVILGDLDDSRFEDDLDDPMDEASPSYCRAVASLLRQHTGRKWSAPTGSRRNPGFYVIPEYGLDPLNWPYGRIGGVELLTPPLPLDEADTVRREIIDAIEEIDGDFNFLANDWTADCGWHINIDAGDVLRIDPDSYILGVDELALLARNSRLYTPYTGLQRHAVGIHLLRHLVHDPEGTYLLGSGLPNFISHFAGRDKAYAANFSKLNNGYLELRHFSANAFFNGPSLHDQLYPIPSVLEIWPNQSSPFEEAFHRKFLILSRWLAAVRGKISWQAKPGIVVSQGEIWFAGEPVGYFVSNGLAELHLLGRGEHSSIASIRGVTLADIPEAISLLAHDLAELRNLGARPDSSPNSRFQRAVQRLAKQLRDEPGLSSEEQLEQIRKASAVRKQTYDSWQAHQEARNADKSLLRDNLIETPKLSTSTEEPADQPLQG